ncbi:MAG: 4Fe-4S dicluster domain-containing protein [Candidatus Bathyarchaeota archaeon]|nr:MAG: 4Fe-4S dicluster domain-containing protein [Candidatus Bathyarchaeota archaeon]
MSEPRDQIREHARRLLDEGKVEVIIGYEKGSVPLQSTPCFVRDADNVERLIWDSTCGPNLAKYLFDREGKTGIVAKACDARSIVVGIVENQIEREDVVVIGVPCEGVIDLKKIDAVLDGKEILEASMDNDKVSVKGDGFEQILSKKEFLCDSCISCRHRNPPVYDILAGDELEETKESDEFEEISKLEAKSPEERWNHFSKELGKCIRCYACRNVCPLCYCKECFVDETMPSWCGKTTDLSDTMTYHIIRALHIAGRCVDCGACSRACPEDIDLRALTKKVEKIVRELYDYEPGLSLEELPVLGIFEQDDPQEFIK